MRALISSFECNSRLIKVEKRSILYNTIHKHESSLINDVDSTKGNMLTTLFARCLKGKVVCLFVSTYAI